MSSGSESGSLDGILSSAAAGNQHISLDTILNPQPAAFTAAADKSAAINHNQSMAAPAAVTPGQQAAQSSAAAAAAAAAVPAPFTPVMTPPSTASGVTPLTAPVLGSLIVNAASNPQGMHRQLQAVTPQGWTVTSSGMFNFQQYAAGAASTAQGASPAGNSGSANAQVEPGPVYLPRLQIPAEPAVTNWQHQQRELAPGSAAAAAATFAAASGAAFPAPALQAAAGPAAAGPAVEFGSRNSSGGVLVSIDSIRFSDGQDGALVPGTAGSMNLANMPNLAGCGLLPRGLSVNASMLINGNLPLNAANLAASGSAANAAAAGGSLPHPGSLLMDLEDTCPELQSLLSELQAPDGSDIMLNAKLVLPGSSATAAAAAAGQVTGAQDGSQQQQMKPHLLIDPTSLRRLSSQAGQSQSALTAPQQMQYMQQQQQQMVWQYMPYGDPIMRPYAATTAAAGAAAAVAPHHHAGMGVMGPTALQTVLPSDARTAQQYNHYYGQQYNQQYNHLPAGFGGTMDDAVLPGSTKRGSPKALEAGGSAAKQKKRPQSRQKPHNKQRMAPGSPTLEGMAGDAAEAAALDGLEDLGGAAAGKLAVLLCKPDILCQASPQLTAAAAS
jgi:hypothetical protein